MKPLVLSVADHGYIDSATGKLYILGTFTHIWVNKNSSFPILHHSMAFIVKIVSEFGDPVGEHIISIILADDDGVEMARIQQAFIIKRGQGGLPSEVNVVWELKNMVFPKAGEYQFSVEVDDSPFANTALVVVQIAQSKRE